MEVGVFGFLNSLEAIDATDFDVFSILGHFCSLLIVCCLFHPRFDVVRPTSKESRDYLVTYEHPLVEPQLSHLRHVPLLTMVKLPHSEQLSPS